ncbi:MAG: hypothetical protein OHK0022_17050 [Roseiflexaceae bacterium]
MAAPAWTEVTILFSGHSYKCVMTTNEYDRLLDDWRNRTRNDDSVGSYHLVDSQSEQPQGMLHLRLADVVGLVEEIPAKRGGRISAR